MGKICFYDSPVGRLCLVEEDEALTGLSFVREDPAEMLRAAPEPVSPESRLLAAACVQLGEYFAGRRGVFDLPLDPRGTDFQREVWEALRAIPFGETRSYAQVAAAVGRPRAFRAVGSANNKNPVGIIIPCHRVIGSDGSLVGYAAGLERKRFLLDLEAASPIPNQEVGC
ncbi:MAG: methylated-DNA--[protein]-cysteine S-methyltransferase [Desulfovibrio sp.]|nr:methylated-DNA--[protein]-cysteine S-methyltransferase [Desulfovibrio sp.]